MTDMATWGGSLALQAATYAPPLVAGAAGSVGHAAGLTISAPVSVVDPETRDHFGDQVGQFNQSVRHIGSDRPE